MEKDAFIDDVFDLRRVSVGGGGLSRVGMKPL